MEEIYIHQDGSIDDLTGCSNLPYLPGIDSKNDSESEKKSHRYDCGEELSI